MSNLFDDDEREFVVLRNQEQQYCLWPDQLGRPDGWTAVHGPVARAAALEYVERQWTDLRPASLVQGNGVADEPG
jgi:MbtH protein